MALPTCPASARDRPDGTGVADRVADDLQSEVVSRLYSAGLSASSLAARYHHDPAGLEQALTIVAELDAAIAVLRSGILDLRDADDTVARP